MLVSKSTSCFGLTLVYFFVADTLSEMDEKLKTHTIATSALISPVIVMVGDVQIAEIDITKRIRVTNKR